MTLHWRTNYHEAASKFERNVSKYLLGMSIKTNSGLPFDQDFTSPLPPPTQNLNQGIKKKTMGQFKQPGLSNL